MATLLLHRPSATTDAHSELSVSTGHDIIGELGGSAFLYDRKHNSWRSLISVYGYNHN